MRIVGIAGSLRARSFNLGLLHAMHEVAPEGLELDVRTLHGVPLYNADDEAAGGLPEAVKVLKDVVAQADGLVLATPEYNNGIPGVFKNAIDWMSRPAGDIGRVFGAKPVALLGASPGGFGTILSQSAWLPVLRTLGTRPWFEQKLLVSRAGGLFDEEGRLTDAATRERLQEFIEGFARFAKGG
jgi:chromate reductase